MLHRACRVPASRLLPSAEEAGEALAATLPWLGAAVAVDTEYEAVAPDAGDR